MSCNSKHPLNPKQGEMENDEKNRQTPSMLHRNRFSRLVRVVAALLRGGICRKHKLSQFPTE
jgi:threonyl-tRNA synthetase